MLKDHVDTTTITKLLIRRRNLPNRFIPSHIKVVDDGADITDDPTIDCVMELMGGTDEAWTIIKNAISHNKHVVTANKTVVARYMRELQDLLKLHPSVHFQYEAAVGGGLPIIAILRRSLRFDPITRISGILNGTTNYILTQMGTLSQPLALALATAQEKGYAEANPESDVSGDDVRSKIAILANLAFGVVPDIDQISCTGIMDISQLDFSYAKQMGKTIKLLGTAELTSPTSGDAQTVVIRVAPTLVPLESPLAQINGSMNAVEVHSEYLGRSFYVGEGAGRNPTANAVVADLLDVAQRVHTASAPTTPFNNSDGFSRKVAQDYNSEFYIRFNVRDRIGVLSHIIKTFEEFNINLKSVLSTNLPALDSASVAIVTTPCSALQVQRCVHSINEGRFLDATSVLQPATIIENSV